MITRKRGKPSVSEQLTERLILAHNPGQIAPRVFSDLDGRFGLVEPLDIAAKCADIAKKVAAAAESAVTKANAASTPADAVRASYPWLLEVSPVNVILEAERAATVNDQAVSALMAHLVNHLIIGEGLKQIATQARAEIVEDVDQIPKEFREFCVKLQVEGVTVTPIERLSKARLRQVADLIKGFTGNGDDASHVNGVDGSEQVETAAASASSSVNSTEMPELGRSRERIGSAHLHDNSRLSTSAAETVVDPVSDPMAAKAAAIGYVVTERLALTAADLAVLGAPAPPQGIELRLLGSEVRHKVDLRMMSESGDMAGVEHILMQRWVKDGQSYGDDAQLAKRWSWELLVMRKSYEVPDYPEAWWEGVILPSPEPGAGSVRQLRRKA